MLKASSPSRSEKKKIEQPMDTVIQVDVSGPWRIFCDKEPGGGAAESVTSLISGRRIGFRLDNQTSASPPKELTADQVAGTNKRSLYEKLPLEARGRGESRLITCSGALFHKRDLITSALSK